MVFNNILRKHAISHVSMRWKCTSCLVDGVRWNLSIVIHANPSSREDGRVTARPTIFKISFKKLYEIPTKHSLVGKRNLFGCMLLSGMPGMIHSSVAGSRHLQRQGNIARIFARPFQSWPRCSNFYFARARKLWGESVTVHIRTYNVFSPYRLQSSHGMSISSCPKPLTSKLPFPFKLPRSHFFSTQRRSDFSSLYRAAPHHAFSPLLLWRFDMYADFFMYPD